MEEYTGNVEDIDIALIRGAYGNFDVKKGAFYVFTEFAVKDGNFKGYVKPLIKVLDIVQWNKEKGKVLQVFWETVVSGAAEIFEN